MTINGIALLIAGIFCMIEGLICYWWGRDDERDAWERTTRRKDGGAA